MLGADELTELAAHRFPGGTYRVAHWENWLITDCTYREPMPADLAHPMVLFHAPILGAGTSIAELFRLAGTDGASGSVALLGYDWEYFLPLREEVDYRAEGGIIEVARHDRASGVVDDIAFAIELSSGGSIAARVTNRWGIRRDGGRGPTKARSSSPPAPSEGVPIPPWEVRGVDAARMKTMAALLRDPYPVHWDREANARLGLAGRVVNQGPLNLGYVANMLMAWAGPDSIRRLTVGFGPPVLDGDHVVARGSVLDVADGVARCAVALCRGDEVVVSGTAEVVARP
jgi:acyl dehydratase